MIAMQIFISGTGKNISPKPKINFKNTMYVTKN